MMHPCCILECDVVFKKLLSWGLMLILGLHILCVPVYAADRVVIDTPYKFNGVILEQDDTELRSAFRKQYPNFREDVTILPYYAAGVIRSKNSFYLRTGDSKIKTGWYAKQNVTVTLNDKGKQVLDLSKGFSIYCVKKDNGLLCNKMTRIDGKPYFFIDGVLQFGWLDYNGHRYYSDPDTGYFATGKKTIDGDNYYFSATGEMGVGLRLTKDEALYFDEYGVCVLQTTRDDWETHKNDKYAYTLEQPKLTVYKSTMATTWRNIQCIEENNSKRTNRNINGMLNNIDDTACSVTAFSVDAVGHVSAKCKGEAGHEYILLTLESYDTVPIWDEFITIGSAVADSTGKFGYKTMIPNRITVMNPVYAIIDVTVMKGVYLNLDYINKGLNLYSYDVDGYGGIGRNGAFLSWGYSKINSQIYYVVTTSDLNEEDLEVKVLLNCYNSKTNKYDRRVTAKRTVKFDTLGCAKGVIEVPEKYSDCVVEMDFGGRYNVEVAYYDTKTKQYHTEYCESDLSSCVEYVGDNLKELEVKGFTPCPKCHNMESM